MTVSIFRVTVRGQFADLTENQRNDLLANAEAHDIMVSAYNAAGTFTYDARVVVFSYRFEVRINSDDVTNAEDADAEAARIGEEKAILDLQRRGLGWKRLRSEVTNMADIWRD